MRDEIAFPFSLAYGLDPIATASAIGGFYEADPAGAYLHPAAFIMGPDGRLHGTTYRSSAVGRLAAEEALALIAFEKNRDKAGA
jgi:hypothetical protein